MALNICGQCLALGERGNAPHSNHTSQPIARTAELLKSSGSAGGLTLWL